MKSLRLAATLLLTMSCAIATTSRAAEETSRDFLPILLGKWNVTGTAAGMDVTGRFEFKWAAEESCLSSSYDAKLGEQPIKGHHTTGWDSSDDSIRSLGFFSHGVMEVLHYKRTSSGVGKGTYSGSKDGVKFQADLTVTVSSNKVTFETTGMKRGGEPSPELSVTFTRIKE